MIFILQLAPLAPIYQTLLENLNYVNVTLLMAIESSVFPLPSEVVVPPAAYMAAEGNMNMALVLLCAVVGSVIGASCNYVVSYFVGRPIVYKFADSKWGHMLLLTREKMEKAECYFQEKGAIATFLGRLLPGIRHLISIPAGLSKMHYGQFVLYTAIGAAIWNAILCLLGWYLHRLVPMEDLETYVRMYERPFLIGIIGVVLFVVCYYFFKAKHKK